LIQINFTARVAVVGEGGMQSDEHIVLNSQSYQKLHHALNCDVITNKHLVFDEQAVANITVRADYRLWQVVCEDTNFGIFSSMFGFSDCFIMHEIIC